MDTFMIEQFSHLDEKKPFRVIQNVYDKYGESSRPVKLSQIKKAYLQSGKRDSEYEETLKKIKLLYPNFIPELNNFSLLNPWEQRKVQAKIGKGSEVYGKEIDKIIVAIPVVPHYLNELKISKSESKQRRKEASSQLQKKHNHSQKIDVGLLFKTMLPMLNSEKSTEYIPALLLVTGRRVNEIVNQGEINNSNSGKWYACFSGQSKIGTDLERKPYEIPLLAEYSKVKKVWEKAKLYLNPKKETLTPKQIANKTRNILKFVHKYPGKYGDATNLHNFRAIYAAICTEIFDRGNISRIAYVSHILGENSINPALHYSSINLVNLKLPWYYEINWDKKQTDDDDIINQLEKSAFENASLSKKNISKKLKISSSKSSNISNFWKRNKNQLESLKQNKINKKYEQVM
jgi:hypothetical protein